MFIFQIWKVRVGEDFQLINDLIKRTHSLKYKKV